MLIKDVKFLLALSIFNLQLLLILRTIAPVQGNLASTGIVLFVSTYPIDLSDDACPVLPCGNALLEHAQPILVAFSVLLHLSLLLLCK